MLAYENKQKVLVVKSPSNNKEQKKFLGYEWSGAKGQEGIKYIGGDTVNDIITPLFNPKDRNDQTKINYLIQQNFLGEKPNDLSDFEEYKELITYANVVDLLDFSRKDFNKAISLNPKKKITIETKWPLVKLGEVVDLIETGSRPIGGVSNIDKGILSLGGEHIEKYNGYLTFKTKKYVPENFYANASRGKIKKNDILICKDGALTGKVALVRDEFANQKAMINEHLFLLRIDDLIIQLYVFNFLLSDSGQLILKENITGSAQGGLNSTNLKQIKIPLPPKEIQEKIVKECEVIDKEVEKAQETIEKAEIEIKKGFNETTKNAEKLKIKDICEVQSGGTPSRKIPEYWKTGTINWLRSEVCQNIIINENIVKEKITELGLKKSSAKIFKKDTVLIALVGATIGKVAYLTFDATTNQNIAGLYPKDNKKLLSKYLFYALMNSYDNNLGDRKGKFTMANLTMIRNIQIPVPPIEEQKKLILNVEKLEAQIKQAREIINQAKEKKQAIMDKYLK